MRLLTSKDRDLSSCFDKTGESALDINFTLKEIHDNNCKEVAIKGKVNSALARQHVFGFCRRFKKITKNLGFHLTFKTANLQGIICTTIANGIDVTTDRSHLFVPIFIPSGEIHALFIESSKKILLYHSIFVIQIVRLLM